MNKSIDKLNFLIVDDLNDNLYVLENLLSQLELKDLHIIKALSGKECLDIAITQNIELIILDVQMPDMNGFEVAKFLKLNPKTKHIPIIFLTAAFKKEEFVREGFKLGAVDYFTKPIEKYSFLAKITVYVELFKKQKNLLLINKNLDTLVDKKTAELLIANKKLACENEEKDRRAEELVIANDEKVLLVRKLQLSQKMEALGKLTGGISHEYNNMLGVISGYSQLIKLTAAGNLELTEYANEILHAGKRAAKLTSKLLVFSQEKSVNAKSINLNMLLKQQRDMLQKTLTISINLLYKLHDDLWQVWLDGSDMEAAILNVCINAMHAMDEHGKLTIETSNKEINQQQAKRLNISSGHYVLLSFTDTGCGFDEKIKYKIFDPFFTTKGELGSGLGLSIVYGFVQNSGGGVDVDSEEGEGTQFRFYFPRHYDADIGSKNQRLNDTDIDIELKKQGLTKGDLKESILLVDDEKSLLLVTSKLLSSCGYNVFCAQDAATALSILESEFINILISDVIMANMDGYELATIVKEKYPDVKIQLVSGFARNRNRDILDISLQKNMLQKPVIFDVLLNRIRKLTDT